MHTRHATPEAARCICSRTVVQGERCCCTCATLHVWTLALRLLKRLARQRYISCRRGTSSGHAPRSQTTTVCRFRQYRLV